MSWDFSETNPLRTKTLLPEKNNLSWDRDLKKHWNPFLNFFRYKIVSFFQKKIEKLKRKRKKTYLKSNYFWACQTWCNSFHRQRPLFLFCMPVFPICDKITQFFFFPLRSLHCSLKAYLIRHNLQSFDHFHGSSLNLKFISIPFLTTEIWTEH